MTNNKGAIEMSIGTIVIIVIAVTMLIFGIVFVRSIMCGAIGLTSDINDNAKGEIDKLFASSGGRVQCIGSEKVAMVPGVTNAVRCSVRAEEAAEYEFKITKIIGSKSKEKVADWAVTSGWKATIAPDDTETKKILRLAIPENAPEEDIFVTVEILKAGTVISTKDLDFEIRREGIIKSTLC